ncbi:MAG: DUF2157 domain-containing protein [Pseudomonadota bacterium]|nr:DUF2157 domain-containing protein [Pseudomonadota bacterium]
MSYQSRLRRDLDRWQSQGWLSADGKSAILEDVDRQPGRWTPVGALAILGSILIALSAISFVGANWDAIPKLLVFILLLGVLWISLLGAGRAFDRGAPVLGHALALLGAALFGIAIMLTAQTFNLSAFRNTAVLIWSLAALATAMTVTSRPVMILATVLSAMWVWLEITSAAAPNIMWSYALVWSLMLAAASRLQSPVSVNLLGIALIPWLINALGRSLDRAGFLDHQMAALTILCFGLLAAGFALLRQREIPTTGVIAAWCATTAVLGGALIQWPLGEYEAFARELGRASDVSGLPNLAIYIVLSAGLVAAITTLGWVAAPAQRTRAAVGIGIAATTAASFPFIVYVDDPTVFLAVRILIGSAYYIFCVSLILIGTRANARATGTLGITGFILHTGYVYWETFSGLLTTSLFFLTGGLVLFGLSWALVKWRKRLPASPGDAS